MKIVFLSNYLNHHQKPISDILYKITNGDYWFVATSPMDEERRKLGYNDVEAPYLITCYNEPQPTPYVADLIDQADAVIIGSSPDSYIEKRNKDKKLVFKYTERLYKVQPSLLKLLAHRIRFKRLYDRNPNCYLLCASAFTASDFNRIGCFKNRSYKWGYFPVVPSHDIDSLLERKDCHKHVRILWVGRFLNWKHPELPIELGEKLHRAGFDFEINMFGIGPELARIQKLISQKDLESKIKIRGAVINERIMDEMKFHDIFLFTSDRKEGWGAVANEAMSNGCTIVASDAIGCVPYLINSYTNGLIFKSEDSNDLFDKVVFLIKNPKLRKEMAHNAYHTIKTIWSPESAAIALVNLIDNLLEHQDVVAANGPCSKA